MEDSAGDLAAACWADAISRRRAVLFRDAIELDLRLRAVGGRTVLLSGRSEGLSRPELLQRAARALRRARRLRAGLRARPRGRPPRADPAGHRGAGAPAAGRRTRQTGTSCRSGWNCRPTASPASGATRAAQPGGPAVDLDPGDLEEGLRAAAAIGDDTHPEAVRRPRDARPLHPRHVRAARRMVPPRLRNRRPQRLQYVPVGPRPPKAASPEPGAVPKPRAQSLEPNLDVRSPLMPRQPAIGRAIPRREGVAKVTGRARYVDDLALPGHAARRHRPQPRAARHHPRHRRTRPASPGTRSPSSRPPTSPDGTSSR